MEALVCPKCGAPLQPGLDACPYCRVPLAGVPPSAGQSSAPSHTAAPQANPPPAEIPTGWVVSKDTWSGFTIAHPPGWEVLAFQGQVIVQTDPTGLTAAGIFPFTLPSPTNAHLLAQQYVTLTRSRLQSFQAWQQGDAAPDSNRLTLRTRAVQFGQPVEGVTNVLVEGPNAIISGYNAPAGQLDRAAPDLTRILATFHTIEQMPRQTVRDTSEGAFTFQIPTGWTWQGGINRSQTGNPTVQFTAARDPQGMVKVAMPSFSWTYTNPVMGAFGAFPGSYPVLPLMPASRFIQNVIVPQARQQYQDFKLENVVDRPDFAEWYLWDLERNGIPRGVLEVSVAVLEVTYRENGARLRAKSKVTTQHQAGPTPLWNALLDVTYRAPEGEFAALEPVLAGVIASQQFNPEWLAREQHRSQERYNVTLANSQRVLADIQHTRQQTVDILHRSALNHIASNERNFEMMDNVINGVQNAVSSSGQEYKVPLGYDRYWTDGLGTVHGGSWTSQPNTNWQELKTTGI